MAVVIGGRGSGDTEKPLDAEDAAKALDEVSARVGWIPSTEFAGYCAAKQEGYHADEGLKVTLLSKAGSEFNTGGDVAEGKADFGIHDGAGLVSDLAVGVPITAIAALHRLHPSVFLILKGSDIGRPDDFPGHSIGSLVADGDLAYTALLGRLGLEPDSVKQVIFPGYGVQPLVAGNINIMQGFVKNEILAARRQGTEVNVFRFDDYGVFPYGDVLLRLSSKLGTNLT